jgi:hypothetical protein
MRLTAESAEFAETNAEGSLLSLLAPRPLRTQR